MAVDVDVDEDGRGREGLRQVRMGNPKKISAGWAVCVDLADWLVGLFLVCRLDSFRCLGRWCDEFFGSASFDLTLRVAVVRQPGFWAFSQVVGQHLVADLEDQSINQSIMEGSEGCLVSLVIADNCGASARGWFGAVGTDGEWYVPIRY